jgi:DNA-binding HxlR family transcriptional regulator
MRRRRGHGRPIEVLGGSWSMLVLGDVIFGNSHTPAS